MDGEVNQRDERCAERALTSSDTQNCNAAQLWNALGNHLNERCSPPPVGAAHHQAVRLPVAVAHQVSELPVDLQRELTRGRDDDGTQAVARLELHLGQQLHDGLRTLRRRRYDGVAMTVMV